MFTILQIPLNKMHLGLELENDIITSDANSLSWAKLWKFWKG